MSAASAKTKQGTAYRARLIKLIHVAKRDLKLDDDTYRAMLQELTGHDSSKALSVRDLDRVLEHMKRRGFEVTQGTPPRKLSDDGMIRKMRSLWQELADAGAVRDRTDSALESFARRITKRDRLEWLSTDQATQVIESLKKWLDRLEAEDAGQPE